jgi:SAM-dependent methyltransferase
VREFVERHVKERGLSDAAVLDVGSYDVNGNLRDLFTNGYVGVDMREGPNVDKVVNAHGLTEEFGFGVFDLVVCCEMLEHDPAFWISMLRIGDVLKPHGTLLFTARGIHFKLHEQPTDLWRFTLDAGKRLLGMARCRELEVIEDPQQPGVFAAGVKYGNP